MLKKPAKQYKKHNLVYSIPVQSSQNRSFKSFRKFNSLKLQEILLVYLFMDNTTSDALILLLLFDDYRRDAGLNVRTFISFVLTK